MMASSSSSSSSSSVVAQYVQPPPPSAAVREQWSRDIEGALETIPEARDLFGEAVDYEAYPSYLELVARPMFVSLIQRRIQNEYYRSTEVSRLIGLLPYSTGLPRGLTLL